MNGKRQCRSPYSVARRRSRSRAGLFWSSRACSSSPLSDGASGSAASFRSILWLLSRRSTTRPRRAACAVASAGPCDEVDAVDFKRSLVPQTTRNGDVPRNSRSVGCAVVPTAACAPLTSTETSTPPSTLGAGVLTHYGASRSTPPRTSLSGFDSRSTSFNFQRSQRWSGENPLETVAIMVLRTLW